VLELLGTFSFKRKSTEKNLLLKTKESKQREATVNEDKMRAIVIR